MPTLTEIQNWFQKKLHSSTESIAEAADFIKGNERLGPEEQILIYQNMYRQRLAAVLEFEFCCLSKVLGKSRFQELVDCFVDANPPTHFQFYEVIEKFATFFIPHAKSQLELDLQHYESKVAILSKAAGGEAITIGMDNECFLDCRIEFISGMTLMVSDYDLREMHRNPEKEELFIDPNDSKKKYICIYPSLQGTCVDYLDEKEFVILNTLLSGTSIDYAFTQIADEYTLNETDLVALISKCFEAWTKKGLIVAITLAQ